MVQPDANSNHRHHHTTTLFAIDVGTATATADFHQFCSTVPEGDMHQTLTTMSFAIILSCAGIHAHAQTPPQRQDLPPLRERQELPTAPKLNLSLEQRHTIKEFIKDVKGEATPRDVHASVGDTVPPDVSLQPMPTLVGQKVPQVKTHRFFVTGQQIVIVDPKDNKVADVINLTDN